MDRVNILLAVAALVAAACGGDLPQNRRASRQTFATGSGRGGVEFGSGSGPGGVQFGTGSGSGGAQFGTGSGSGGFQFGTGGVGGEGPGPGPSDGGAVRPAQCGPVCDFLVECGGNFTREQCVSGCMANPNQAILDCVAAAQTCPQAAACLGGPS